MVPEIILFVHYTIILSEVVPGICQALTMRDLPGANSSLGAQVERNHSHFIMVDNGRTGSRGWGGENSFRVRLEAAISQEVPSVTIVMGGG